MTKGVRMRGALLVVGLSIVVSAAWGRPSAVPVAPASGASLSPVTPLDYREAAANPLKLGVTRTIVKGEPAWATLDAALKARKRGAADVTLRPKYVREQGYERELTEAEKQRAREREDARRPWDPPSRHSLRVPGEVPTTRSTWLTLLRLGDRAYDFRDCEFLGEADLDGDGAAEVVVTHVPPITHAGAYCEVRVFAGNGTLLWRRPFSLQLLHGLTLVPEGARTDLVVKAQDRSGKVVILVVGPGGSPLTATTPGVDPHIDMMLSEPPSPGYVDEGPDDGDDADGMPAPGDASEGDW